MTMVIRLLLLALLLVVAACAAPMSPPPPPPAPAPAPPPVGSEPGERGHDSVTYHVWGALLSYGAEKREFPGYGVYSYVLFNANSPNPDSVEGSRYDALLRALLLDVKPQEVGAAAGWNKIETNIFCVPSMKKVPKQDTALATYNYQLSLQYLAQLQESVRSRPELFGRLQKRPGPFLVSLYRPLPYFQGKDVTTMLYLDLTDMPADGMRQVLEAYRQRLNDAPLKNVEKLKESLSIVLMKYALMLDENLKIVPVAFARFK